MSWIIFITLLISKWSYLKWRTWNAMYMQIIKSRELSLKKFYRMWCHIVSLKCWSIYSGTVQSSEWSRSAPWVSPFKKMWDSDSLRDFSTRRHLRQYDRYSHKEFLDWSSIFNEEKSDIIYNRCLYVHELWYSCEILKVSTDKLSDNQSLYTSKYRFMSYLYVIL